MVVHSSTKAHSCGLCGRQYKHARNLMEHEKIAHSDGEMKNELKKYACHLCEQRFRRPMTLVEHLRVHSGEKPFPCTACGQSFTRSHGLKRHQTVCYVRMDLIPSSTSGLKQSDGT
ncbi:hypothetical protein CRM22_010572 [Opisthorchis felineus]|uniref:C2H2-type domain-containing protein n=1 Tax=Opisthorchis felineus TaxID=147828 RepID=A0A4S2KXI1_OPIFE|nr:hypothetical protein CRM22_010572 [Opisthorchis felineus]